MKEQFKFFLSLLIISFLIYSCKRDDSPGDSSTDNRNGFGSETQYIMSEPANGDRTLIIDIIQGEVTFVVDFQAGSNFNATLKKSNGEVIKVLGEGNKPFTEKTTVDVNETSSYLLDVRSNGRWIISRE